MSLCCTKCKKSPPEVNIKHCAKCSKTPYCSRDCQKADWKAHKKICSKQAAQSAAEGYGIPPPTSSTPGFTETAASDAATRLSPPKGLDQPITKPFTRLDNGTWLHDRPENDVYRCLIDVYRMRVEDMYKFEGDVQEDSLYGGAPDGSRGFCRFLKQAEKRNGLLPPWWNAEKRAECVKFGDGSCGSQYSLGCAVEKSDIIEHYGDPRFPMQLRMFADSVYNRGIGGRDGSEMRKMLVAMEAGEVNDMNVAAGQGCPTQ